jgi:tetrahydromethanopterin S-methyltransferase subunit B
MSIEELSEAELKEELQKRKQEVKNMDGSFWSQVWSGIRNLLAGKITPVPELTYKELSHLITKNLPPVPEISADAVMKEDLDKLIQYVNALNASMDTVKSIARYHYITGFLYVVGRIGKSMFGMWILLQIFVILRIMAELVG